MPSDDWIKAVVSVGGGRGFVVATDRERLILTAGHCLPHLPPSFPALALEERTFAKLIGPIGDEPFAWAECLFVDPIADLAVLGSPDHQEFYKEAEAYEAFTEATTPLRIGALAGASGAPMIVGFERLASEAWLLSLDGRWFSCRVESAGRGLWIEDAAEAIRGGMSGSPIVTPDGSAIGVLCVSSGGADLDLHRSGGPNPELSHHLPGWAARLCARVEGDGGAFSARPP